MSCHILGFPRIGHQRELKFAQESFWKGKIGVEELQKVGAELRLRHWNVQKKAGLSTVATGDFSMYDKMLDTCLMLGAIPSRFAGEPVEALETYFHLARGDKEKNIPAMEMTKWFNTNYHYIVPEIEAGFKPKLTHCQLIKETDEAIAAGFAVRPVVIGPITWLALAKGVDGVDPWSKLSGVVAVYSQLLAQLAPKAEWIQIDEPILAADLPAAASQAFADTYYTLVKAAGQAKLMLTTYFDAVDDHLDLALASGCAGLHIDTTRGGRNLDEVLSKIPAEMVLSLGVVDGRNIWKNDFDKSLATIAKAKKVLGNRVQVASSCSLLHTPIDLAFETALDPVIKDWLSFAVQKCEEVVALAALAEGKGDQAALEANRKSIASRHNSPLTNNPAVRSRVATVTDEMLHRKSPYTQRVQAQKWLNLPLYPTTTIGSFPQTAEIRKNRLDFRKGNISEAQYKEFLKKEIAHVVKVQEELDLDVLVHGESERNDMVEYFGQQMDGFCFTLNGWVQSYGSRCVKPPVIYGDVSRPAPMTVEWITYAQSLTKRPMKGMLTGPVTILCWSFVRDDMEREDVTRQLALAVLDEVKDLEKAGIRVIQIDEAALSEGMPIKEADRAEYLRWAVENFRLATSGVEDSTQIHTHMCYSEFNSIIASIADMDADVISIEASRSKMELLDVFHDFEYPNEIGPGIYDIHSERIPTQEEMEELLERASEKIPKERLWANPDCGLKTRGWAEVMPALTNLVAAAKSIRARG